MTREVPGYARLVARLTASAPAEGETTLVHGDFRLDNVLVTLAPQPRSRPWSTGRWPPSATRWLTWA